VLEKGVKCEANIKNDFQSKFFEWPMGGIAKSRYCLGRLMGNNLRHGYLIVIKLGNYGIKWECLNNNH
jgi:hypothetical protein